MTDESAREGHARRRGGLHRLRPASRAHWARTRRRRRDQHRAAPRRGGRPGGRVRLGPERPRARRCSPTPGAGRSSSAARSCSRARTSSSCRPGPAPRDPRHEDRVRAAGPGRRPQPGDPHRPTDRRAAGAARHRHVRGTPRRGQGRAARGRSARRRRVSSPATRISLSGGQVQRVALAMAFLPRPKVLVLDEPTTGLDVTTQDMVLQTLSELCRSHRVAALYVTHDLAVVANIADRVAVMYAGQIIELGPRDAMFRQPAHPYALAGRDPAPVAGPRAHRHPGSTPGPGRRPTACRFNTRCEYVKDSAGRSSPRTCRSARSHRQVPAGRRDRHLGHQQRQHHRRRPHIAR